MSRTLEDGVRCPHGLPPINCSACRATTTPPVSEKAGVGERLSSWAARIGSGSGETNLTYYDSCKVAALLREAATTLASQSAEIERLIARLYEMDAMIGALAGAEERLEERDAENERLRTALEPFAKAYVHCTTPDHVKLRMEPTADDLLAVCTVGDMRNAARALHKPEKQG